ncbi:MAG: amino acid adenylation domain-containing protein [Candidatus Omnitrophota bacterium]
MSVRDLSGFDRLWMAAGKKVREKEYWLEKLSGDLIKSHFPYTPIQENVEVLGGNSIDIFFDEELSSRLMKLSADSDIRLHIVLSAILTLLLSKYTDHEDIIIGTGVSHGAHGGHGEKNNGGKVKNNEGNRGEFINTILALRNRLTDHMTFKELLLQVRQTVIDSEENRNYPFEVLVRQLGARFSEKECPLFDVAIILENIQNRGDISRVSPKVVFLFSRVNGLINGKIHYDARFYNREAIKRIGDHFHHLSEMVLSNLEIKVSEIEVIPEEEKKQLFNKAIHEPIKREIDNCNSPNDIREKLVKTWMDILKDPAKVEYSGNFQLRGHSSGANASPGRVKKIRESDDAVYERIQPVEEKEYYDLTHSQTRVWTGSQIEDSCIAFNMPSASIIDGALDTNALIQTFYTLVNRHESLRTVFIPIDGEPKQRVKLPGQSDFNVEESDFRQLNDKEGRIKEEACKESEFLFDLARGPLLRVRLIRLDMEKYVCLFNMHHIISDAVSMDIFISEVRALYDAYRQGKQNPLARLRIQYKDFAAWQNRQFLQGKAHEDERYWLEQFRGELPVLELPADFVRPAIKSYRGNTVSVDLDEDLTEKLRNLGKENDVTLFMVFLGLINVLFYGYSGQTDMIVGTPIAGREHMDLENQIGFYLNTLALRTRFTSMNTFAELLEKVRKIALEAYAHQSYPFDVLLEALKISRDPSRHPLFDVMLNMINYTSPQPNVLGNALKLKPFETGYRHAKFDLVIYIYERETTLTVSVEYNLDLFENKTIRRMLNRFLELLNRVITHSSTSISRLLLDDDICHWYPPRILPPAKTSEGKASYHQERLWFINEFETGYLYESSPVYHNIPLIVSINGSVDEPLLEKSICHIIKRHTILHTRIETRENKPILVEDNALQFKLFTDTVCHLSDTDALSLAIAESQKPFRLSHDLPIRGKLIRWETQKFLLVITFHHIVADKQSLELFLNELVLSYDAFEESQSPQLPELAIQFPAFCSWQQSFSEELLDRLLFYWKRKLNGKLQPFELPTDRPRALIHIYHEAHHPVVFPQSLTNKILSFNKEKGGDFVLLLLLSAFKILLHRYCDQSEIIVGTSTGNRPSPDMEPMIGPAANLLVLRSVIEGSHTFSDVFEKLNETVSEALIYGGMPFDRLVLELNPENDMSRTALFDVLFQYEEAPFWKSTLGEAVLEVEETNLGWGKYDLNFLIQKRIHHGVEIFCGQLVYNRDYYDQSRISRLLTHYQQILERVIVNPHLPISRIDLLSEVEKEQLLWEWNGERAGFPKDQTIHNFFEKNAAQTPDRIAVIGPSRVETSSVFTHQITYHELNEESDRLAALLIEKGVGPDTLVAIKAERSVEMIIGILGILKSGGAYLPIDPDYPRDRIDYMLMDSRACLLVNYSVGADPSFCKAGAHMGAPLQGEIRVGADPRVCPSAGHRPPATSLAYIIYTSGTTGRPKGVMVEHRNVVSLLFNEKFQFDFNGSDIWTMFHSHCFDFSVWELFGSLLNGGRVVVVPKMVARDTAHFLSLVRQYGVTILNQTPSAFYRFIEVDLQQERHGLAIRTVIFGGEALHPGKLKQWHEQYPSTRLINMFGITETTVHVTYKEIGRGEIEQNVSNIGQPIPTLTTYIMDRNLQLQPIGIGGELMVGGAGVTRGYLNRPELTVEKFVENPYKKEERLYRSGDLARFLEKGELVYLGRIDHQVQLRGFRIELGEIENQILKYRGIKEVVVVDRTDESDDIYLCAYIVSDKDIDPTEIKRLLTGVLPDYMIPSFVVRIDRIPLTSNGKIDRSALPKPQARTDKTYSGPRTKIEMTLVSLWSEVLNLESNLIGIDSDFFDLGGHSLKATILAARIHKELHVKIPLAELFKTPTIRRLAEYIKEQTQVGHDSILPVEEKEYYPVSSAQKRLYLLHQMDEQSEGYNVPYIFLLEGEVQKEKFEEIFWALIRRHESFRTSFHVIDDEPVQRIHDEVEFKINFLTEHTEDTAGGRKKIRSEEGQRVREIEKFIRSFDLTTAPLIRVGVLKIGENKHLLLIDMDHIISDGTSMNLMVQDFMALYNNEDLPSLRVQYKDFSEWQKREFEKESLNQKKDFWLNEFSGEIPVLELPLDFARPVVQSFEGSSINFEIDQELTGHLNQLAIETGATLYMVLLAAYTVFLSKVTNQEDIIVGSPIAGRNHSDLEQIVGMFINTLALRNYPEGEKSFTEFITEVKENALRAFENQEYQYEELVEHVVIHRDTARNPLFDVMFVLQNFQLQEMELPGLKLSSYAYETKISKFDLTLSGMEVDEKLVFAFEYSTRLFKKETIERLIVYLKNILNGVVENVENVENKDRKISDFEILTDEEKEKLLFGFNDTEIEYPNDKTIHQLFEEQAARTPGHVALIGPSLVGADPRVCPQLSYNDLNERSDQLALELIKKGVGPDVIVGVKIDRSLELMIGVLGILKAGGAYLPIDPGLPQERINYMLKDSGAALLLTSNNAEVEKLRSSEDKRVIALDHLNLPSSHPLNFSSPSVSSVTSVAKHSNLAYIIYTSGSTGNPKGVMVNHASVVNLLYAMQDKYPFHESDTYLLKTSYVFDVSVTELFGWFMGGGRLAVLEKGFEKDPDVILNTIERRLVTHINFVPSMFNAFIGYLNTRNRYRLSSLKYIFLAGEALLPELVKKFNDLNTSVKLENIYGPTESTVYASWYSLSRENKSNTVPIGKPLPNIKLSILNKYGHLQSIGIAGELWISGQGLARGYLNRPELTLEKFSKNFYKTGDLCRWSDDGNIEFLGRFDQQVKIRGFRIELEEIENRLLSHEKIKEAVVVIKEDRGDKYLRAYVVSDIALSTSELRNHLSHTLPDYMVPSYFMRLDALPLTVTGKINRRSLPSFEIKINQGYIAPENEVEEKLTELWSEVLGRKKEVIGTADNFFELGGHSLKAVVLISKIQKQFHVNMPLGEVFNNSTIRGLAYYIKDSVKNKYFSIEPIERKEFYELSSAQKRLYVLHRMDDHGINYNIPAYFILEGDVDKNKLEQTFIRLIERHESLRTSFHVIDDEPVQRIHDEVEFKINFLTEHTEDTEGGRKKVRSEEGQGVRELEEFIRSFDLTKAPLMRVGLFNISENKHLLMLDMHHIISDGSSMNVMIKDFMTLYHQGEYPGEGLPKLRVQYKDFSEWQSSDQQKEFLKRQGVFWSHEFEEDIPVLELPIDYTRPAVRSVEGRTISFEIDQEVTEDLKRLSLETGATMYMVFLTIYNIFLSGLSQQDDIVVGSPVAGRRHTDLEKILGMFVNTLAMRHYPRGEKTFNGFLQEVKEKTLNAFENQDYPFEDLVDRVVKNRDMSRNPLFDTMFVFQNIEISEIQIPGLILKPYEYENFISKFDLTFIIFESKEKLRINVEYSTSLFREETILRFIDYFRTIVDSIIENRDQRLSDIEILSEEEKEKLLVLFNDTAESYPTDKTLYHLFEDWVDRIPDHAAIVFNNEMITYRHFDEEANRLAHDLQRENGVQSGDRIAVIMDRSIGLMISLMGIMKARAAYVPLDASLPGERLRVVLDDASVSVVISNQRYGEKLTHVQQKSKYISTIIYTDALNLHVQRSSRPQMGTVNDAAYVMYTSGSSGTPKGVLVKHRTIVNTVIWRKNNYQYAPGHVSLQVPPYFFDSSVTDIFTPLSGGACLVLIKDNERTDLQVLKRVIINHRVSHFIVVPVFYNVMLEEIGDCLTGIKMITCAGENFPDELIRKHFEKLPQVRIFNEYGPTENSVNTTAYELRPESSKAFIGKPISNVRVYILDKYLHPVPIGVMGEMCLAGSSLAVGYLNNPELTNQKFLPRFFQKAGRRRQRIYRTGDMGRWLADGNLEFLGRVDTQVKIRGMRIEIGEIENCLMKHVDIKEVVVQIRHDDSGSNVLCAYLVPHPSSPMHHSFDPAGLKEYLSGLLPHYMIPSYFTVMEKIPINPNGKIDMNALPEPWMEIENQYAAPRNEIERELVRIWEGVLGKKNIGINDNFFYIGGDSIKSIQIISRMNHAGYKLEMKDLFQYPLISELSSHVKKIKRIPDQSAITGIVPLTPIQKMFFNSSPTEPHHYNQAVMFYSQERFDKEILKLVFKEIQTHHDALRMTYSINKELNTVVQISHGLDHPLSFEEYELRHADEIQIKANRIQAGIDLERGPLMKVALFHLEDGDRLLIVIHHLVIDGISWRILFEDIETLYSQYKRGETPTLTLKTDSFKFWSEKLSEYANSKNFLKEIPYWSNLESHSNGIHIPTDFDGDENNGADIRNVSFGLNERETGLLIGEINRIYNTEVNDILLTALGMGIKKTFENPESEVMIDHLLIASEGHGREEIMEDIDISRTLGWFTIEYPVWFDMTYAHDIGRQIKEVKETLRKIPNKGIGYGILKYLTDEENKKEIEFKLKPQLIFNYLGQFDADIKQISQFEIAKESAGNSQSIANRREYGLEINGMITNNCLNMTLSYNQTHFKKETIEALIDNFSSQLKRIILFCSEKENPEFTPADFTYKGLSIDTVEQLMKSYGDIEDIYTLSPMQEGMLFHALVEESSSYFEQTSYRLKGELNIEQVKHSLNELARRHDVLRTTFVYKDMDRPIQVVLKNRAIDFYFEDIINIGSEEQKEKFIKDFKANDKKRSFDLGKEPLARASILRLDHSTYEFIWSFHHILMDGWCIGILNSEFFEIYNAYVQHRVYQLPITKPYRSYIQWLEKQDKKESAAYWEHVLDGFEEQTGIPQSKIVRDNSQEYRNDRFSFELDKEKTAELAKLAARYHVTVNIVTRVLWGVLLGKYNGKDDVVFGAVVSGRPAGFEGIESMVGLFINTIPVRIRFEGKTKFHSLLQHIQEQAIVGEAYHYHPLAEVQSKSSLKQNLIDHIFIFENYPIAEQIEGYGKKNKIAFAITNVESFEQTTYNLNILLAGSDKLTVTFQYNGNVYDQDYIKRIACHFRVAIDQVIEDKELRIDELTFLSEEEKIRILDEFNNTNRDYSKDKTIHQLFEEQAGRTPGHIAVIGSTVRAFGAKPLQITYQELNERSDQLAHELMQKGVQSSMIVGIKIQRSVEMIMGILGILKTGSAYLPIDYEYPQDRIDYILKDSQARLLVTANNQEVQKLGSSDVKNVFSLDPLNHSTSQPLHFFSSPATFLAYVIYTSGSTGKPKGVMIAHRNVVNFITGITEFVPFTMNDRILSLTTISFDIFGLETLVPLTKGSVVVVGSREDQLNTETSGVIFERENISIFQVTPSRLQSMVLFPEVMTFLRSLKFLLVGGEAFPESLLEKIRPFINGQIFNMYGPTETTIWSTIKNLTCSDRITIGTPIANNQVYIIDRMRRLQPIGVVGEICIGGEGMARGYLNRPGLTDERFLFWRSRRIYMTGDLGRWLDDGTIEFLGRIDNQVKIRGFRIELGEIESRLNAHSGIKDAVVIDRGENERKYLCAYIVAEQSSGVPIPSYQEFKIYLEESLPTYMVPACFIQIDKIPLNANGKMDRRALPQPLESDFHSDGVYEGPKTRMQRIVAGIWKDVLNREKVGIQDNFFELGGNSLDLVKVSNKLREKLNREIPVATLFNHPTIHSLVLCLTAHQLPGSSKQVPGNFVMLNGSLESEGNIFLVHEVLGDVGAYMEFSQQLGTRFNCWGIEAEKLRNYAPRNETIEQISAKYISQIKEIQAHGPYYIATWSWGGHIGLEMALQLERMNEEIALLAFFDCLGPDFLSGKMYPPFSLQTEKDFLNDFFVSTGNRGYLDEISDLEQLWLKAVEIITSNPVLVEQLRQLLIINALALPDYGDLTGEELIQYLNLTRTHTNAGLNYVPSGKIYTPIHYFWANQNTARIESWNDYCHNRMVYHEIIGDHHSIFRNKEQIIEFAHRFNNILKS